VTPGEHGPGLVLQAQEGAAEVGVEHAIPVFVGQLRDVAERTLDAGVVDRDIDPIRATDLVDAFCAPFASLPFDDACIDAYARLRADLRAAGTTIGANDLAIAAIALTHGLGLVSDDRAAFARVPDLTVTSWRDG
jgi:predicted nucleic acid-binding protein